MRHEIVLAPEAVRSLRGIRAYDRAQVIAALEAHLRYEPTLLSQSSIRRLRGMARPQFRLRVGGIRAFYDVRGTSVEVLAIVPKPLAESWLREKGTSSEEGRSGQS